MSRSSRHNPEAYSSYTPHSPSDDGPDLLERLASEWLTRVEEDGLPASLEWLDEVSCTSLRALASTICAIGKTAVAHLMSEVTRMLLYGQLPRGAALLPLVTALEKAVKNSERNPNSSAATVGILTALENLLNHKGD